ncbi:MAG: O-antigen ligase family protein [Pseudomonadota bacterium]
MLYATYIIKSLFFILPALAAAVVLRPKLYKIDEELKLAAAWAAFTALGFTLKPTALLFIVLALVLLLTLPRSRASVGGFFFAICMVLPPSLKWLIPFPGINFLISLTPFLLVIMVVGMTMLLRPFEAGQRRRYRLGGTTTIVMIYSVMVLVFGLRSYSTFTNELRALIVQSLELPLFFLIAVRLMRTPEADRGVLQMFILAASMVAAVGLVSFLKQWDLYAALDSGKGSYSSRGGGIRVGLQFVETMLGYFMVAFAYTLYLFRAKLGNLIVTLGWAGAALIVVYATNSRAAVLAAMMVPVVHFIVTRKSAGPRAFYAIAAVLGAGIVFTTLSASGFQSVDTYGTFDYRQRLFDMSFAKIREYPFFGDAGYAEDPFFEPLRQGQGIIDFVSVYVQVMLSSGFFGLALFFAMPAVAVSGVLRATTLLAQEEDERSQELVRYGYWLATITLVHLVVMATISSVSFIDTFFFLMLAACQGFIFQTEDKVLELRDAAKARSIWGPEPALTPQTQLSSSAQG